MKVDGEMSGMGGESKKYSAHRETSMSKCDGSYYFVRWITEKPFFCSKNLVIPEYGPGDRKIFCWSIIRRFHHILIHSLFVCTVCIPAIL